MSLFQFIACDNVLPELYSAKKRFPNGEMKKCFDTNEDFTDIEIICLNNEYYDDIPYYSSKKHVYSLVWDYSDDNCKKLWQYLKDIRYEDMEIEIWSIWLCDYYKLEDEILTKLERTKRVYCSIDKLSIDILKASVKCRYCENIPKVIIIK
jgi:DNA-binding transcriptional regulator GbsR (MarR family)